MIKFFSKLASCYRSRCTPPPLTDDNHLVSIYTSGDLYRVRRHSVRRCPQSHWRPALSVIMEDSVVQDHGNNVGTKSDQKSCGKSRSMTNIGCFSKGRDKRNSKPKIFISPFSSTPYIF